MSSPAWTPEAKRWILGGGLVLLALLLLHVWPVFIPFILACVLAYLLNPIVNSLSAWLRFPRGVATLLVFLNLLALLAIGPVLLVPALVRQAQSLNVDLESLPVWVESNLAIYEQYQRIEVDGYVIELPTPEELTGSLERNLTDLARRGGQILFGFASGAASIAVAILLVLVFAVYLLKDAPRIMGYIHGLVPPEHRQDAQWLVDRIDGIWASYFRGQLLLAGVMALVVTTGLAVLGVPRAILLGLLAGIMEVVPVIGPVLAMIPAVVTALVQGSTHLPMGNIPFALVVVLFYVLAQQLENNLLVPRILGSSVALHPIVVILAILAGASLAGILGVFLAAPVLASIRVLAGYGWGKIVGPEPAVPIAAPLAEPPPRPAEALPRPAEPAQQVMEEPGRTRPASSEGS